MLLSMDRIADYIENLTIESFQNDYKTIDAVIRNLEVIGEASKNIPDQLKEKHTEVPWKDVFDEK